MDRKRAKELLPIIQAFADGKTIQYFNIRVCDWYDTDDCTRHSEYRIKPEPREFILVPSAEEKLGWRLCKYQLTTDAIKVREVIE